jgi:hypothetical protein
MRQDRGDGSAGKKPLDATASLGPERSARSIPHVGRIVENLQPGGNTGVYVRGFPYVIKPFLN